MGGDTLQKLIHTRGVLAGGDTLIYAFGNEVSTYRGLRMPIAPECAALSFADALAPGATFSETTDEAGDEKYQCCIHPWMRAVVHIAAK